MQAAQSSRVASGAEHQFSHLWDMQHHTHNGHAPSHGFKVGIGTLATTALYERLLASQIEKLDADQLCAAWPDEAAWAARARELLGEGNLAELADRELHAKHCSPSQLREQLRLLQSRWPRLREQLRTQLLPLATLRQMLQDAGAPTEPEQIGITQKGGTMRLGGHDILLREKSRAARLYKSQKIRERFRHRYEVNPDYVQRLEKAGMVFSGCDPTGAIMQVMELPDHPYFLCCQFHPELTSKLEEPAPLGLGDRHQDCGPVPRVLPAQSRRQTRRRTKPTR